MKKLITISAFSVSFFTGCLSLSATVPHFHIIAAEEALLAAIYIPYQYSASGGLWLSSVELEHSFFAGIWMTHPAFRGSLPNDVFLFLDKRLT